MTPPRRVLLCRTDRLGDVILALPGAKLVKRLFPESRVGFLVRSYTAPLVALCSDVDSVHVFPKNESPTDLILQLKEEHYDAAIALYPEARVAKTMLRAGIPLRAGIAYRWASLFFNYRHREHRKHNLLHEAEYNLSLVYAAFYRDKGNWRTALAPSELFPLNFHVPVDVQSSVQDRLGSAANADVGYIALHPGGGGSAHRWAAKNYAELAAVLVRQGPFHVVLTGSSEEIELCREVERAGGEAVLNLCGQVDLPMLAEIYRHCRLVITNSTGPLHLARAVGTAVLGLFPNDPAMTPKRWGPYGWPENVLQPPEGQTMAGLAVSPVMQKIAELTK